MKPRRQHQLTQLLRTGEIDLLCERCQYNLRGLAGDVKNCPECAWPNSILPDEPTEGDISSQRRKISKYVMALNLWLALGLAFLFAIIPAVYSIVLGGFFCCFMIPLLEVVPFAMVCWYLGKLQKAFPPDNFYLMLGRFPFSIAISCCYVALLGIATLSALASTNEMEGNELLIASVISSIVLVLCIAIVRFRIIRPLRTLSLPEFEHKLQESAVRLAKAEKWESIRKRIDESSLPEELR